MTDVKAVVQRCPWFEGIPEHGIDKLVAAAQVKQWPAGSCLYAVGESTTVIHCVLSGRVRLYISSATGSEFTITDKEQESWLAQQSLVGDQTRMLTAQVKDSADILTIPRAVVLEVGEKFPVLYKNLFQEELKNARGLYELFGGMLFYPLRVRLAGRLLELLGEHGQDIGSGIMLETRLSQNDFANLAMGSRQRVNKIFREWNERGILSMEGDRYLVTDIDGLRGELEVDDEE
jgi:CRP/FNR family transcriptional regulator, cyclic AMP receptor protein